MARILVRDQWYRQLSPGTLYESEFERVIQQHAEILYPGYFLVPFKVTVQSDEDSARADFALVSKNYTSWWVVEVEKQNHSL